MKRVGHLFESVTSFSNLCAAAHRAARGKKDRPAVASFLMDLEHEIIALKAELCEQRYIPGPLHTFEITDPKRRLISAAPFRDRVVFHALCSIVEPYFERRYIFHSYACRKGKGTHAAIAQAQRLCRKYYYYLKLDIASFFASIDHRRLKMILDRLFKDERLLSLLHTIIDRGSGMENETGSGTGLPIGNLTSQHFANLYLDQLDHFVKDERGVKGYLRYMDDFVLFSDETEELHLLRAAIERFLTEQLRLELNPRATALAPVTEGLNYLGLRIFPDLIRLANRTKYRRWKKIHAIQRAFERGAITEAAYAKSMQSITEHLKIGDTYYRRRDMFENAPG